MDHRLIRNAEVNGQIIDILIEGEHIAAMGPRLAGEEWIDAAGGAALPGLHDHHIHLLGTAALIESVRLDDARNADDLAQALRERARTLAPGRWLRATGYHERMAGPLDAGALDRIIADRPVRVQHQTGGLWMLNGLALAAIAGQGWPESVECATDGTPTGRIFRGDAWLSERIGRKVPDLVALGQRLARRGITGVTDASITNDADSAALLGGAVRQGLLPLRLMLMSGGAIEPPEEGGFAVGPVKILLDDDRLPPLEMLTATIAEARSQGRRVAAHCVTAGELAMMLAAFEEAGAIDGDRIEHGSIIPVDAIPVLRRMRLTVVTQPGFIATRGDRYRALVDPFEQPDLYRTASLIAGGVGVAGSSDAPYGDPDPWAAIDAAITRRTASGALLGERGISPERALDLFLGRLSNPAGLPRRLTVGGPADICLLTAPLREILAAPRGATVAATLCRGAISYRA